MDSIPNLEYMEFLWRGEFSDREKYIVRGSDGKTKPLFMAGIYFLWNKDGLQYIGQSDFIWSRFQQHHVVRPKELNEWIIGVIPISDADERLYLELYCITKFCPPRNIKGSRR